ncbi:MAG: ABC transporter ATP-binding protein [Actinobacteria bacterium]|jgi:ABC-2 type transport system ATP-binding protein|nr:ABC transporter ATP-binding protein [Actinomycetota bacterium]
MEIALQAINLTKKYSDKVVAVDKLNLEIGKGEIFGLLGPNGAGKTTTGGMLTTRILPSSGSAYIGGIDVVKHPAEVKHEIGVVPQTNTLDRSLSVEQNLYFHGRYFGFSRSDSKMRTEDLLRQFRLSERADAPVMALSGGMAQRLMLARAVFHSPTVLILDEPTSGLDPQSRLALWDVLGELHSRGQTILLTTHYMEEADHLCQRLAIMDHGKILALGTPNQLKSNLGSGSTLWVEANRDSSTYIEKLQSQDLLSTKYSLRATGKGVTIIGNAITEIISTVTRTIESQGLSIVSLKVEEPTLETVFISLTGRDLRE